MQAIESRCRWKLIRRAIPSVVLIRALVVAVQAHEEDWRKLAELLPRVEVPAIRGQEVPPGGSVVTGWADSADMSGATLRGTGFAADQVTMLSWLPLSSFGSPANGNDCWGYVSSSGREYALLGTSDGTHVIEVTDPVNPTIIGFVDGADSLWRDIKVHGDYAYAVSEGGGGIQVIDLTMVDSGVVRHVTDSTNGGMSTTHNIAVNPDTPYLYLSGSNVGNGSIMVVSIVNPENPVVVGRWQQINATYSHDAQIVSYTDGPFAGREIAYSFDGGWGLQVVDVTDKGNIFKVSGAMYAATHYSHQGWLSEDRKLLYLNDELDESDDPTISETTTRVFNVENPANPTLVGIFSCGNASSDHNLYTHNGLIYQANYTSGLQVFDATNPVHPVKIASFDTHPENDSVGFNGAWSVYPYLPSGTILVSDLQRGLFVLRVDAAASPFSVQAVEPVVSTLEHDTTSLVHASLSPVSTGAQVRLHTKTDSGGWSFEDMTDLGDGVYRGTLPSLSCGDGVSYYFSATKAAVSVFDPPSAPDLVYHAISESTRTTIVHFDGESDAGWASDAADTATTGKWARGVPGATGPQTGADITTGFGALWATDPDPGSSVGVGDVDGGTTTLLSPIIDMSGQAGIVRVGYWRWYSNNISSNATDDEMQIDLSDNGGSSWSNVETIGVDGSLAGWRYHEFRVDSVLAPTNQMRLRFVVSDFGNANLVEAAIDEVSVFAVECDPVCSSDWDGSGVVNSDDFFSFLDDFFSGGADFNGSGTTNSDDFFAFLDAFFAGC